MAEKRMFTQKIVESDDFLDMPCSAQALYFHLNMRADDDGFINNPRSITRSVGASADDLKLLIAKRFVLAVGNCIVIKHWRMNNTLRKDRYKPTQYQKEFALLTVKENGAYTDNAAYGNQMATTWQPSGNHTVATKYSVVENSVVEDSIGECREEAATNAAVPTPAPPFGTYNNVILSDKEIKDLEAEFPTKYEEYINRLSTYMAKHGKKYKSHYVTIKSWLIEDKAKDPASFNADVFFEAAVNHTKAKQQERTPEEREALRKRVEALKKEIG